MKWIKIAAYSEPGRKASLYAFGPCLKSVCVYGTRCGKYRYEIKYIVHDKEFPSESALVKYLNKQAGK